MQARTNKNPVLETPPPAGPEADLIASLGPTSTGQKLLLLTLGAVLAWGVVAYVHQLRIGLAKSAMMIMRRSSSRAAFCQPNYKFRWCAES